MQLRIAFIGIGALGAIYLHRIQTGLPDADVFAIADGERADRLEGDGLRVNGAPLPLRVERPDRDATPADVVFIATKAGGLDQAIGLARPFVAEGTVALSLINGIHSEAVLAEALPQADVLLSMTAGSDVVRRGSEISFDSFGKIAFGRDANDQVDDTVRRLDALLTKADVPHEVPLDMRRTLWWKFMANVGVNPASALLDADYGQFQGKHSPARDVMRAAQLELIAIANARGIDLDDHDITAWQRTLDTLAPRGETSMLQDMRAGRATEIDIFSGEVVRLGRELDIPTPVNGVLLNGVLARERIVQTT